jgi:hypothetical protein
MYMYQNYPNIVITSVFSSITPEKGETQGDASITPGGNPGRNPEMAGEPGFCTR